MIDGASTTYTTTALRKTMKLKCAAPVCASKSQNIILLCFIKWHVETWQHVCSPSPMNDIYLLGQWLHYHLHHQMHTQVAAAICWLKCHFKSQATHYFHPANSCFAIFSVAILGLQNTASIHCTLWRFVLQKWQQSQLLYLFYCNYCKMTIFHPVWHCIEWQVSSEFWCYLHL